MPVDANTGVVLHHPRKVTIVESIVDQIIEQIQQGKLNPGDRLPSERQLIEMLGVSRSSVREALQGLALMGLVESRPGQGSFISPAAHARLLPTLESPSMTDRLERKMRLQLIEARRAIESPIARLAAERATPEGVAVLRQRLADYAAAVFPLRDRSISPRPHTALHLALAELAGNPFFLPVVENLLRAIPSTLRSREEVAFNGEALQQIVNDEIAMHERIVDAVERHDGDAAYQAMDDHLDYERRLVMHLFPQE